MRRGARPERRREGRGSGSPPCPSDGTGPPGPSIHRSMVLLVPSGPRGSVMPARRGGSAGCRADGSRSWRPASRAGPRSSPARARSRHWQSAESSPAGVEGSPSSAVYATPTSRTECASDTATPASPCSLARAAARSFPPPRAWRCGPRPSRRAAASVDIRASMSSEPRRRSNGCGIPTRPPCSRTAATVSAADIPGATARSRYAAMRSPSAVLTSSPTMTVSPAGAAARAASAPSIRSWSVTTRCVNPRAAAARTTSPGRARQSKLAPTYGNAGR